MIIVLLILALVILFLIYEVYKLGDRVRDLEDQVISDPSQGLRNVGEQAVDLHERRYHMGAQKK